jgi:hypothetical protein
MVLHFSIYPHINRNENASGFIKWHEYYIIKQSHSPFKYNKIKYNSCEMIVKFIFTDYLVSHSHT